MHFKDRLVFWHHAALSSPNLPKAHNGLGPALFVNRETEQAESEYNKALVLNPDEWLVHGNLGLLYMETGRLEKAEEEYKEELMLNLTNTSALLNLGILYYPHGERFREAKALWERVLEINPNSTRAHEFLAIYFYQKENDIEQSVYHSKEVLKRGGKVQEALMDVLREYHEQNLD